MLGVSSVLAAPSITFDGVYSYCDETGTTLEADALADTHASPFTPDKSICLGKRFDADGNPEMGVGQLEIGGAGGFQLATDRVVHVFGAPAFEADAEDKVLDADSIIDFIPDIEGLQATGELLKAGLYLKNGSQISAVDGATGMKVRLYSPREEGDSSSDPYLAVMWLKDHSNVNVPVEFVASGNEHDALAIVVDHRADASDIRGPGEAVEGASRAKTFVIFKPGVGGVIEFTGTMSGDLTVVAYTGISTLQGGTTTLTKKNTYTGQTHVEKMATLKGRLGSFGGSVITLFSGVKTSGGAEVFAPGKLELASFVSGDGNIFSNEVVARNGPDHLLWSGDRHGARGKLVKSSNIPGVLNLRGALRGWVVVEVKKAQDEDGLNGVKLEQPVDFETRAEFHIDDTVTLDLGGTSRIIGGLHDGALLQEGDRTVTGGADDGEVEMTLDVFHKRDLRFTGDIKKINKLIKHGAGKQILSGSIYKTSSDDSGTTIFTPIEEVVVKAGQLYVEFGSIKGTPPVDVSAPHYMIDQRKLFVSSETPDISPEMLEMEATRTAARFVVSLEGGEKETFSNEVTGTGTLVKAGDGFITFTGIGWRSTGELDLSMFELASGHAILKPTRPESEPGGSSLNASKTAIQLNGNVASGSRSVFSLNAVDTVIAGLKGALKGQGGSAVHKPRIVGFIDEDDKFAASDTVEVPDDLPVLTMKSEKGLVYKYVGDIKNVKKIVLDGSGVQKILGKVTRSATKDGNPVVAYDETIVEMQGGELQIASDAFDPLIKNAPVKVYSGSKFVLLAPMSPDGKFENPIQGGDGKGYGVVEFVAGAKISADVDLSNFTVQITGSDFDFMGISESISGLISDDEHLVVRNRNADGVSTPLVVNIAEGEEAVFKGELLSDLPFVKDGAGKQTIDVSPGYTEEMTVKDGHLGLKLRGDMAGSIIVPEDAKASASIDIVLSGADETRITGKITLFGEGVVNIIPPDADLQGQANKIVKYSNTALDLNEPSGAGFIRVTKGIDLILEPEPDAGGLVSLGSGVSVDEGGKLKGTGIVKGKVIVEKGGVLAPGNSLGGLLAEDGFVLMTGMSYEVESGLEGDDDWKADVISAPKETEEGINVKTGVTLLLKKVDGAGESEYADRSRYEDPKIIVRNHTGNRFGIVNFVEFADAMQPIITYKEADGEELVQLAWEPFKSDRFGTMENASVNQKAFGEYIDRLGPWSILYQVIAALNEEAVLNALDAISGAVYAEEMKALLGSSEMVTDAISSRMREVSMSGSGTEIVTWGGVFAKYKSVSDFDLKELGLGGIAGFELPIKGGKAGIALTKINDFHKIEGSDERGIEHGADGSIDSYYISFYGSKSSNRYLELRGSLTIGQHLTSVSRNVSFENAAMEAEMKSDHSAVSNNLSGEVLVTDLLPLIKATGFRARNNLLFRVDHSFISVGESVETSMSETKAFVLRVEPRQYSVIAGTVGATGSLCFGKCETTSVRAPLLNYMLGFRYKLADKDGPSATLSFDRALGKFDKYVSSVDLVRKSVVFGLGLEFGLKPVAGLDLSVTLEGLGEVSGASCDIGGAFRVSASF